MNAVGAAGTTDLHTYASTFPSQGGVEIGPYLEQYAADVPEGSAIVEVGCWLGAGTAWLALGAMKSGAAIHSFDRWIANDQEVEKAAKFGLTLKQGMDTLPIVQELMRPIPANVIYHKGNIHKATWKPQPIGLYVDDASKNHWLRVFPIFQPSFLPGKTILVLMDFYFYESAGPKYAEQQRYMKAHSKQFEPLCARMGGTTSAVFRYLG